MTIGQSVLDRSRADGDLTAMLQAWKGGDQGALDRLVAQVYRELRAVAAKHFAGMGVGETMRPTVLINEVYLRLLHRRDMVFANRGQFFWFAGQLMRQILVEYLRARMCQKRGAGATVLALKEDGVPCPETGLDGMQLLALDEALAKLQKIDPRQGRVVALRFFAGLEIREIADLLGVSPATVKRDWQVARLWFARELSNGRTRAVNAGGTGGSMAGKAGRGGLESPRTQSVRREGKP